MGVQGGHGSVRHAGRYSLRNLKRVVPTKLLKDYMLPPTSPLDESAMQSPQ